MISSKHNLIDNINLVGQGTILIRHVHISTATTICIVCLIGILHLTFDDTASHGVVGVVVEFFGATLAPWGRLVGYLGCLHGDEGVETG